MNREVEFLKKELERIRTERELSQKDLELKSLQDLEISNKEL